MGKSKRARAIDLVHALAADGLRTIAVASRLAVAMALPFTPMGS
jgi:hypothetical protein